MSQSICLLTGCLDNYLPLAQTTIFKNKANYCDLYGYRLALCREVSPQYANAQSHASGFSWSRLELMHRIVRSGQHDWVYCVGCDTMITNFLIGLEDIIAYAGSPRALLPQPMELPPGVPRPIAHLASALRYRPDGRAHVVFAADRGSVVQADSFLVRGSPQGAAYLEDILAQYEIYQTEPWVEQQAMMDLRTKHAAITVIVPQCALNSYDYGLFADRGPWYSEGVDCYGERGQWQPGDFLIHWPSTPFEMRLRLARKYDAEAIQ